MPTLLDHPSSTRCKICFVGDSSSGKTGALACLANAGYELFIQDFDEGLDILRSFVDPDKLKNVHYVTLKEAFRATRAGPVPKAAPTVYSRSMDLLNRWIDPKTKEDFGGIATWDADRILVIDSATAMGEAAYRFVRALNQRQATETVLYDYAPAQNMQEGFIEMVMSDAIKCNVIIIFHISYQPGVGADVPVVGQETKPGKEIPEDIKEERGYPSALGKKLPPRIGRHFNTMVMCHSKVFGGEVKRTIRTTSTGLIELKNPVPHILKSEIPQENGLLEIFDAIKTHGVTEEEEPKPKALAKTESSSMFKQRKAKS